MLESRGYHGYTAKRWTGTGGATEMREYEQQF